MQIREIRESDKDRWDEFVRSCEYSTPQHLIGWKEVIEETFNSEMYYFLAEEDNQITGVLPLIHIKSLIAGHYITSLPGGLCTSNQDAARLLLEQAKKLVNYNHAKYLILRDGRKKWDLPELVTNEDHVTFMIKIKSELEDVKRTFNRRTRQLVNRALQNDLRVKSGIENLDIFYPIFAQAMREKGTPTLGLDFFKSITVHSPNNTNLLIIYNNQNQMLGGGFIAPIRKTVFCTWAGMLREFYKLRTSHLLTWSTITYALEQGFQWVDLGRSKKDSGGYVFKKNFGAEIKQLFQQFYLNGVDQPPTVGVEIEDDLKFRYFVKLWRKLPQNITEKLGPELRRVMPFG